MQENIQFSFGNTLKIQDHAGSIFAESTLKMIAGNIDVLLWHNTRLLINQSKYGHNKKPYLYKCNI